MKKALFLLAITALFSCTKEKENTINGRWKIVESSSDVSTDFRVFNNSDGYVEFKANGEFGMDNSNINAYYKALKDYNRYSIISDDMLKLYSTSSADTVILNYYFHQGLILSYGYTSNRFTR